MLGEIKVNGMQWKNKKKNTFVAEISVDSHFFCNLHPISKESLEKERCSSG